MTTQRYLCVIPARWNSHNLPGKPLLNIGGKTMMEHVYRRARASGLFFRIVVATDDYHIYDAAEKFGADVIMTRNSHPDSSCRVAEIAAKIDSDIIMNIGCDEPMFDPRMVRELAAGFSADNKADVATICIGITSEEDFKNPEIIKVVRAQNGRALYFSRSPIPYQHCVSKHETWGQLRLYAFKKKVLEDIAKLPQTPTPLSSTEKLEQLRLLEYGFSIAVIPTKFQHNYPTINTANDLKVARQKYEDRRGD